MNLPRASEPCPECVRIIGHAKDCSILRDWQIAQQLKPITARPVVLNPEAWVENSDELLEYRNPYYDEPDGIFAGYGEDGDIVAEPESRCCSICGKSGAKRWNWRYCESGVAEFRVMDCICTACECWKRKEAHRRVLDSFNSKDGEPVYSLSTLAQAGPEIEPRQCYLCSADESEDGNPLSPAGMPQSDLLVCERCEGSQRHQQDLKEAWLAEESEV